MTTRSLLCACTPCTNREPVITFAIVKPAADNACEDMRPYGQSVFADAVDAIQAVDLAFDAMISEIDNGKMRVFLSDVMFDQETDGRGAQGLDTVWAAGLHRVPEGDEHGGHDSGVCAGAEDRRSGEGVSGARCRCSAT